MSQSTKKETNKEDSVKEEIIIEWNEEAIFDDTTKKIWKYLVIIFSILFFLVVWIYYTFFNINNNEVWLTDSFFSKNIEVYNKSGIKIINPFNFNKKITYPTYIQTIKFDGKAKEEELKKQEIMDNNKNLKTNNKNNIYTETYISDSLKVNTKDEISVKVGLTVSYKLKTDPTSIKYVYNNSWNWNFVEKIVLPTITSAVSSVYSQYKLMDIVSKKATINDKNEDNIKASIWTLLKDKIKNELDKKWFNLINFTFSWTQASDSITKTLENLFSTQNQLQLEKTRFDTLVLKNKNALKELELINHIDKDLKENGINIDNYQKIKMIQIFEKKWNGNTIPNWLADILK